MPRNVLLALVLLGLGACTSSLDSERSAAGDRGDESGRPRQCDKNIDELQRVALSPQACSDDAACPAGSHCEDGQCSWSCYADSDCGDGYHCTCAGTCEVGVALYSSMDGEACAGLDPGEVAEVLSTLNDESQNCIDDVDCPCGSYCSNAGTCFVECIEGTPDPFFMCLPGQVCDPLGRCVEPDAPEEEAAIPLTILFDPGAIIGDTHDAALQYEVEIVLESPAIDVVNPENIPEVWVGIAELEDPAYTGPRPQVSCAPEAELGDSCTMDRAWVFSPVGHQLRSAPRAVTVELPQSAEPGEWTLIARSRLADAGESVTLLAQPGSSLATESGRYEGTLSLLSELGDIALPVSATVTSTHVVVDEPSGVLFPEGRAVIPRDPLMAAQLPWIAAEPGGGSPYEVRVEPGASSFDDETLRFTLSMQLYMLSGRRPLALDAARIDDLPPTCAGGCPGGTTCVAAADVCLAGAAPTNAVVARSERFTTSRLDSAALAAWTPLVKGTVETNARLGGRDAVLLERIACYRSNSQARPGYLGLSNVKPGSDAQTGDLECADGNEPYIFPFFGHTQSVTTDAFGNETFNLAQSCLSDLRRSPTNNLAPQRTCVSLPRFFGAIHPRYDAVRTRAANQLYNHFLRQWLELHAFIGRNGAQEGEYDALFGDGGSSSASRFDELLGVVETGWRVLLDYGVRQRIRDFWSADHPDYRVIARPRHRWSFTGGPFTPGTVIPDREGGNGLRVTGDLKQASGTNTLLFGGNSTATCETQAPVALAPGFSLAAWVGSGATGWTTLLEKQDPNYPVRLQMYRKNMDSQTIEIRLDNGALLPLKWKVPYESGYYVIVGHGEWGPYQLYHFKTELKVYDPIFTPGGWYGASWGAPGKVRIGCRANNVTIIDEVSFWDRPLSPEAIEAMGRRILRSDGSHLPTDETVPPSDLAIEDGSDPDVAPDDQAVGLPAHILETAAAHLDLVGAYLEGQREAMYAECAFGGPSATADAARARAGQSLRYVLSAERYAETLMSDDAPVWSWRYEAARGALAGRKRALLNQMAQLGDCQNPLGISEQDLALYTGPAEGSSSRFFASSSKLAAMAADKVAIATSVLNLARSQWQQQRESAFRVEVAEADRQRRIRNLRGEFETQLRRLCGARPGGDELLQDFFDGEISAADCYLELEQPRCRLAGAAIEDVPADCLRGQLGEQVMRLKAAKQDVTVAQASLNRSIDQYDAENDYCIRRQDHHAESEELLQAHLAHMRSLRKKKRWLNFATDIVKGVSKMAVGAATGNPALLLDGAMSGSDLAIVARYFNDKWTEDQIKSEEDYKAMAEHRAHELDLMACFHGADNYKYAIDAAEDVIVTAFLQVHATQLALTNLQAELTAVVEQASGELVLEEEFSVMPPHHHFWVAESISSFRTQFGFAKRLAYLSVRALEYEAQQSLDLRDEVLQARTPAELGHAVAFIEGYSAPFSGGFVVGEAAPVLSLRDEILRFEDIASNSSRAPGEVPRTAEEAFREYLLSPSAEIYRNGEYLGKGVRFTLRPMEWSSLSCAERIWRLDAALQMSGALNNATVVLMQENAFGSQYCDPNRRGGELQLAQTRPQRNLLIDEAHSFTETPTHTSFAFMPMFGGQRDDLGDLPEGEVEAFAGRGLYGNYILLFPKEQFTTDVLARVKDVLLRFDIVWATLQ